MDYKELTKEFLLLFSKFHKSRPTMDFSKFNHGEMMVLNYLFSNPDQEILPSNICNDLHLSSARVAVTLNSLEKKNCIERTMLPADRRKIMVNITEAGRRTVESKRKLLVESFSTIFERLGEYDTKELIRILTRIEGLLNDK